MNPVEREILSAWRSLSRNTSREVFDLGDLHAEMDHLSGKSRATATILRQAKTSCGVLADAGIVWRERASKLGPGMGRCLLYHLRSPAEVAANWKGDQSTSQDNPAAQRKKAGATKDKLEKPSEAAAQTYFHLKALGWFDAAGTPQVAPAPDEGSDEAWTLQLISQLIERCSRTNSRERAETLVSHIMMGGEMIEVEAARVHYRWESGTEFGLIAAEDSQLILAIITMAMQGITRDLKAGIRPPRNRVSFDLLELSKMLHPQGGRQAYRGFQRGMARIINTVYRLGHLGDQGKERFSFRLIENVTEGEGASMDCNDHQWTPKDAGMRYFSFQLNSHIWNSLLRGQGWLVHPELLYERSGMIHRVYHHLRTHAKVDTPYEIEADDLAKWLVGSHGANPARTRQRFREELKELLHNRAQRTQPVFSLLSHDPDGAPGKPLQEEDGFTFRLFDLDLQLRPCDGKPGNYFIEAKQSPETLEMLRRQDAHQREMLGRQGEPLALESDQ